MGEQLLERDPAPRQRRRGKELQAAAARLRGERRGQGEDRPEAGDEREERAVLVLEVAAERLDVDGLAGQALEDRRQRVDEVDDLLARLRRSRTRSRSRADPDEEDAQQNGDDEDAPPRIAEGLAEDATETEIRRWSGTRLIAAAAGLGRRRLRTPVRPPRRPATVLGEERLLERRLAAHEVEELVVRGRPDDRRDRAGDPHPEHVVVGDVADAGQGLERADGTRRRTELDLVVGEVAKGLDPVDGDEPARRG